MGVGKAFDLKKAIHEVWAVNEAMNQLLLKHMDARAWRAEPPVGGRTIAAIFSHMHNDRLLWMTVWAKGRRRPAHTSRHTVTKEQAARALAQSAKAMENLLAGTRAAGEAGAETRPQHGHKRTGSRRAGEERKGDGDPAGRDAGGGGCGRPPLPDAGARRAPPRADHDARAAARLPPARESQLRHLALGEAVEEPGHGAALADAVGAGAGMVRQPASLLLTTLRFAQGDSSG